MTENNPTPNVNAKVDDIKNNINTSTNNDNSNREQTEEEKQSTMEWAKVKASEQYDAWMPWIEDTFLKYFTKDNKASYVAREQLDKTKVTGVDQVDKVQDDINNLAAGQLGQGGMLEQVGNMASKEGVDRADPRLNKNRNNNSASGMTEGVGGAVNNLPAVGDMVKYLGDKKEEGVLKLPAVGDLTKNLGNNKEGGGGGVNLPVVGGNNMNNDKKEEAGGGGGVDLPVVGGLGLGL